MQDVSRYKGSEQFWLSDSFWSHQLGYKLSLAIKVEEGSSEHSLKVSVAVTSSEGKQSSYLEYPCIGNASIVILNPKVNDSQNGHELVDLMFMIVNKDPTSYPEIHDQTEISTDFIHKDCLFFRVEKVEMNERAYKLWLLDAKHFKQLNS